MSLFCRHCEFSKMRMFPSGDIYTCHNPANQGERDLVSGNYILILPPQELRVDQELCGPFGKWWKPKSTDHDAMRAAEAVGIVPRKLPSHPTLRKLLSKTTVEDL